MASSSKSTKGTDGKDHHGEETTPAVEPPSTTATANTAAAAAASKSETDPLRIERHDPPGTYDQHTAPNIRDLQPQQRRPGDFDRDLMPPGGRDDPAGNLMGPNHPMFGGGGAQPPAAGGYGMRPRFDPYGPPGGPQDPRNDPSNNRNVVDPRNPQIPRQPRPPPGGSGDPNPDHERPPNDLNNNMFM